ncbi:nucleotide sugar dehydrogenase [Roseisolibacter agri]|uniref:nucleotide sugar dehydrogenase n=1 Tax=Roseisolibacter agri TaxID=2014610 RepID=UPI0024E0DE17|nr:nucleotide sugar dehydrogenase [Roseisolibacter agri]
MATSLSVFGLGYVGCVSAACFAQEGCDVVGVDVSQAKVDMVNAGRSTIVEEGIGELVAAMRASGRLRATTDVHEAVRATAVSLIAVGTPSRTNGSIDLRYIERVCEQIGEALRDKAERHTVVVRSTIMPGTIDSVVIPALERTSGKKAGVDFGVCSNPEFLREGTSIKDFYDPPFTLIGAHDPKDAEPVAALYAGLKAPVHVTAVRVAEMIKYVCNCFHGLKIGFANEVGNVCKALGIDSHEVMRLVCEDRKLNISPAYLKPGFAFGGSCLPKDLRALTYQARTLDVDTPIMTSILESNRRQIDRAFHMVMAAGSRRVGVLGLAFKAGTDDLRESPMVSLIEMLLGKGVQVAIYDPYVRSANLIGANREYIEREIPHIWSLMRASTAEVLADAETVVVGNSASEFREIGALLDGQPVIDLARAFGARTSEGEKYQGICW